MSSSSLESRLSGLLNEDIDTIFEEKISAFDKLLAECEQRLVLFGAGGLGKKTLASLKKEGISPVAFADNNPTLWGQSMEEIPILSPAEAAQRHGNSAVFIVTIWSAGVESTMATRQQQLLDLGCSRVVSFAPLFWKYPKTLLPHYSFDLPSKMKQQFNEIKKAFYLFEDEASRYEYLAQLKWRFHIDFDALPLSVAHEAYFPNDLVKMSSNEVFIDCGAFDGDSINNFVALRNGSFRKIIAFEPDPKNFIQLQENIAKFPSKIQSAITLYEMATGAIKAKVSFDATGTGSSSIGLGSLMLDSIPLDEILSGCYPTYIKMDVEGSELDALIGGQKLITRCTPVLAVCAYHSQNHLWQIPLLINSIAPKYQFFIRSHRFDAWDMVCYAIPTNRCIHPQLPSMSLEQNAISVHDENIECV